MCRVLLASAHHSPPALDTGRLIPIPSTPCNTVLDASFTNPPGPRLGRGLPVWSASLVCSLSSPLLRALLDVESPRVPAAAGALVDAACLLLYTLEARGPVWGIPTRSRPKGPYPSNLASF